MGVSFVRTGAVRFRSFLLASLLLFPITLLAQDSVASLRQALTSANTPVRVSVDGIFSAKDLLGRPTEIRIVNGSVNRSFLQAHNNQNIPVPPGTVARIVDVATPDNAKNDILRVTIEARGMTIPLAFLLAKGSLAGMTEAQLQDMVGHVLTPAQAQPQPRVQTSASAAPASPPVPGQAAAAASTRQPLDAPAVAELNGILKGHQGDGLVKPENVRAVMASPDYTPDNMIVGGVFKPESRGMHHGMRDMYLWPNSPVQFISLGAFTDDQHDLLHLVVRAPIGGFAPFTWEFPKGQLATMSKAGIMHVIDPIVVFAAADENTFRNEPRSARSGASGNPGSAGSGSSFSFRGLSLGLSKQDVAAIAAKTGGFTHPDDSSETLVWFKDTVFEYKAEFGAGGKVTSFDVYPLDHNARLVGLRRGSLYQATIQAFGQPTKTNVPARTLSWTGPAGSTADYFYSPDELWPASLGVRSKK